MATPRGKVRVVPSGKSILGGRFGTAAPELVLVGPTSGIERSIAPYFIVMHTGTLTGPVKVTLSDGAGGQFWPLDYSADKSVTISPSSPTARVFYAPSSAGAKTIALSNDGGLNNGSGFAFAASAYVAPSATPFRLTRAGVTIGSYATLQQVKDVGNYQSGDVVKATGGTYIVDSVTSPGNLEMTNNAGGVQMGVEIDTLTIEWETPYQPMMLDYSKSFMLSMWTGGQPQAITMGSACRNLTLRGIHIRGARPPKGASWFGAAVWTKLSGAASTATLTVEYCKIRECPDGVKTQDGRYDLSTHVRYCVFEDNSDNRGLDHDIYTGRNALTYVLGCTFRKTQANPYPQQGMGHFLKSRCRSTIVRACLFDGWMSASGLGGVAQSINTPNGGVVEIVGNTFLHYGALSTNGKGEPLRYGDDQHTQTVDTNPDPSLTEHSLLFAQNTIRQALGRAADGSSVHPIQIYPTGIATTLLSGSLVQTPVTATVRNNIVANDTGGAATFLTRYPDNTVVAASTISNLGLYSGTTIPGSPAVSDAPYEWVGELTVPIARSDTNRGGRTPYVPGWVPTTAWQYTAIPGTIWNSHVKNDGTGVAPRVTSVDPGPNKSYEATWEYSGAAYSRKNHEFWFFGGGHAATTNNILTKANLAKSTPDVEMVSAPTPEADRRAWCFTTSNLLSTAYFPSDGKPYSPHAYWNNLYIDQRDEFISFCIAGIATSSDGISMGGGTLSFRDIAGFPRGATAWRPEGFYKNLPTLQDSAQETRGPRLVSADGDAVYYWPIGYGLRRYNFSTNSHTTIGGSGVGGTTRLSTAVSLTADGTKSLHVASDSGSGWGIALCDLATGIQTNVTTTGDAIPAGMTCYGVEYVDAIGKFVAVHVNTAAYNAAAGTITSIIVSTIELTGPATAVCTIKPMDGVPPVRCASVRGMAYDPAWGVILLAMSPSHPIISFKVA